MPGTTPTKLSLAMDIEESMGMMEVEGTRLLSFIPMSQKETGNGEELTNEENHKVLEI